MSLSKIHNRQEAARLLAQALDKYAGADGVVLAIPRGGVPIAAYIARQLHMPLDLVLTKKIGHPANPEFAIGSASIDTVYINEQINVPHEYIDAEVGRIREGLRKKQQLFLGNRPPQDLQGKIVLIVDDGIATGNTLISTIHLVKKKQPRSIVVAVPVAPPSAVTRIGAMVDEIVCLLAPRDFYAVGQFYEEFLQVSDEEVIALLKQSRTS